MFFAYPLSIEYLRLYYKVLIIDCTYNTNSASMLLFKAIGINATRKSFCVSFKFLLGEVEEELTQALKHLREILGNNIQPGVILTGKVESIRSIVASIFPE
jgi:hypothetical protein